MNLINQLPPKEEPPPPETSKLLSRKVKLEKPPSVEMPKPAPVMLSNAPLTSAIELVALSPEPIKDAPPEPIVEPPTKPAAPLMMTSELSLTCPQRTSHDYPSISRRLGEQGQVKLQVELDEAGKITSARVVEDSGHTRLDEAGLAALKSWHCNAATGDGKAVQAVALQPFYFRRTLICQMN